MRIQHNILAMNAYRNYTNNTSALAKNLEKLSSGYKINRAGDDAAGLAISEKMRAQITGLDAAQKNVKDGVSLVKTAEGALSEVHDMLNRMVYLANQSANGTYDDTTDRANLQKELDQLRAEINRIADSANFNGIQLLDGTMSTTATKGMTSSYDVSLLPDISKTGLVPDGTVLHRNETERKGGTEISIDFHDYTFSNSTEAGVYTITIGTSGGAITLTFEGVATATSSGVNTGVTADKLLADLMKGTAGGDNFRLKSIQVGSETATITVGSNNTVKLTDTKYGEITMSIGKGGDNRLTFKQTYLPDGDKVQEWTPVGNSGISALDPKSPKSKNVTGNAGDYARDISRNGPDISVTITTASTVINLGAAVVRPATFADGNTVATFAASYVAATAADFDEAQNVTRFADASASINSITINTSLLEGGLIKGDSNGGTKNKINLYYDSGESTWKLAATGGTEIAVELKVHPDGGKIQIATKGESKTVVATLGLSFSTSFSTNNEGTAAIIAAMATAFEGTGKALTIATADSAGTSGLLSNIRDYVTTSGFDGSNTKKVFQRAAASGSIAQNGLEDFDAAKISTALAGKLAGLATGTPPHDVKLYYNASDSKWKLSVGTATIDVNLKSNDDGKIEATAAGVTLFKLKLSHSGAYNGADGTAAFIKDMQSVYTKDNKLDIGTFQINKKADVTAAVASFAGAAAWDALLSGVKNDSALTPGGAGSYSITLATDSGNWKVRIGGATLAANVSYANGTLTIATGAGGAVLAKIKLSGAFASLGANAETKLKEFFGNTGKEIGKFTPAGNGGTYTVTVRDTSNLDLKNFIRQNTASATATNVAVSLISDGSNWKLKVGSASYAVHATLAVASNGSATLKILSSSGGVELFEIKLTSASITSSTTLGSLANVVSRATNGIAVGTYSFTPGTTTAASDGGDVSPEDRAEVAQAIASMTSGSAAIAAMTGAGLKIESATTARATTTVPALTTVTNFSWIASAGATVDKASLADALDGLSSAGFSITVDHLGTLTVDLKQIINSMSTGANGSLTMGDIRTAVLNALQKAANAKTSQQLLGSDGEYWVVSDLKFVDDNGSDVRLTGLNVSYTLTKIINPKSDDKANGGSGLKSYQLNIDAADYALVDGGERLASTWINLSDVKDKIADGNSITIGTQTYVFTTDRNNIQKADEAGNKYVFIGSTPNMETAAYYLQLAAKDNTLYTVGWNGKDRITLTEKRLDEPTRTSAFTTASGGSTLTSLEAIAGSIQFNTGKKAAGKGLTLQIGDTSDSYNQLIVSIEDCHTSSLGIADIDISTQEGAQEAVDRIKDAINYISNVRGTLGATQNRLEHTANNLSVMAENIQDAESTIRDTDVAEEMMSYVKNNILIQSAQAMLAQANQIPQGVLQLLG